MNPSDIETSPPRYLTIDDVCDLISISRGTLEKFRKPRENKAMFPEPNIMIGKSPRWEQSKLISWLKDNGYKL